MNKITFYILTFLLMLGFLAVKVPYLLAGVLTLTIMMSIYLYINFNKHKGRLRLLNQECDPQAFIENTEQQLNINKNNSKAVTYLNIDKAAGLICLGQYEEAKRLLYTLEDKHLSPKNGSLLIYNINLLSCMYELNEIQAAEEYYEKNIPDLLIKNPKLSLSFNLLLAERLFFTKKYTESEELLNKILNRPISNRARLSVLYRLALIELEFNRINEAQTKLRTVAEQGNKLWITTKAHNLLKSIKENNQFS